MVTGLVKSEARNRGLRLGLTSSWRAARKERNVKNEGFIIMSVVCYIGQLKDPLKTPVNFSKVLKYSNSQSPTGNKLLKLIRMEREMNDEVLILLHRKE